MAPGVRTKRRVDANSFGRPAVIDEPQDSHCEKKAADLHQMVKASDHAPDKTEKTAEERAGFVHEFSNKQFVQDRAPVSHEAFFRERAWN